MCAWSSVRVRVWVLHFDSYKQDIISNGSFSSNHDEHLVVASPDSPLSPKTPPQIIQKIYTSPDGKHGHKPSLPIAPTAEFMDDDSGLESNISFAETLFPVTPLHDRGCPRQLNGSSMMMEERGFNTWHRVKTKTISSCDESLHETTLRGSAKLGE